MIVSLQIYKILKSPVLTVFAILLAIPVFIFQASTKAVAAWGFFLCALPLIINLACCLSYHLHKKGITSPKNKGFILFHAAFLMIIVGGLASYASRTQGYVGLAIGQEFYDTPQGYGKWHERFFSRSGSGIRFVLKDMVLEHWPNGKLKEITNTVEAHSPDGRKLEAVLDANTPLYIKGLIISLSRYYGLAPLFTFYGPQGLVRGNVMLSYEKKTGAFAIPGTAVSGTLAITDYSQKVFEISVQDGEGNTVQQTISVGDRLQMGGAALELSHVSLWSGLSVVHDPCRYIVYLGFILFLLGIMIFYRYQLQDS